LGLLMRPIGFVSSPTTMSPKAVCKVECNAGALFGRALAWPWMIGKQALGGE
jgi:hypothetical protein